jgi:hypothetical protein
VKKEKHMQRAPRQPHTIRARSETSKRALRFDFLCVKLQQQVEDFHGAPCLRCAALGMSTTFPRSGGFQIFERNGSQAKPTQRSLLCFVPPTKPGA